MLRDVHADASAALRAVLPAPDPGGAPEGRTAFPRPPAGAVAVLAPASGFLVRVDEAGLLRAATEAGAIVVVDRFPGSSLIGGTPVGAAWSAAGPVLADDARALLLERISAAVHTDFERTAVQDVGYGLRQLTDVANKALSPGINDPTTAVHALGHISALLCELADRDPGPVVLRDEHSRIRVLLARPGLADLLESATTQPRRYGASDPQVTARLYALMAEVAWHARPHQRDAIAAQLARLEVSTTAQDYDPAEHAQLARLAGEARNALAGQYTPARTW